MVSACEGLQLIAESYLAIMHALMVDRDRPTAFGVWQSMLAAGIDPQKGWLMLCKDCFCYGFASSLKLSPPRGVRTGALRSNAGS